MATANLALRGILTILFFYLIILNNISSVCASDTEIFTISVKPNVLIILDNSNSMDEDFYGNAVASFSPSSKSVIGKKVLIDLINAYVNSMRIGIMTYRLPSSSKWYLHNSAYFVSYEPKSYCPNPPADCVAYCRTGDVSAKTACQSSCESQNSQFDATYFDEIITASAIGTLKRNTYCSLVYPKTQRLENPTNSGQYMHFKRALPYYSTANEGTEFDYSSGYTGIEYPPSYNTYSRYRKKTGHSDGNENYSEYIGAAGFVPTDSDYALGYANFGRRLFSYYVGRTWFANTSPGGGYLHIQAQDNNPSNDNQLNTLLAKLRTYEGDEAGYMGCTQTSNPNLCSYIVNAGLTPTEGTLQSSIDYFGGASTPIQYSCQKNFIVYVTDGLPSVDTDGHARSASYLMDHVKEKLTALRNLTVGSNQYDIKTYIVGVGLNADDKGFLNEMAVRGGADVNGEAYFADNPDQLQSALGRVFVNIIESSYSFSLVSVTSTRRIDENYLYEASFEPINADPFWKGHLRKYEIENDGTIGEVVWDGASLMNAADPLSRRIYTYLGRDNGLMTLIGDVSPGNFKKNLDVAEGMVETIRGYVRGEAAYNPDSWRLGDVMHSTPITIGGPSYYFTDILSPNAFSTFRENKKDRERIVLVGANDGQFRSFAASNGSEKWSFIPPNLLGKLKNIYHSVHPVINPNPHQIMVDGPVTGADVWLGSGDGLNKLENQWRTLVVFAEGRGTRDINNESVQYLWSKWPSCDEDFSSVYSSDVYKHYCGYWAFDVTNTSQTIPTFQFRIEASGTQGNYLAEPWSRMALGRVKIAGNEKWVGFIGGGYDKDDDPNRGKGFFVVDLSNGAILWSYNRGTDSTMSYSLPGAPAIVDTDNDGFIDTAYIGDLGGNVWRLKFCTRADGGTCGISNWTGGKLFQASAISPIYTGISVGRGEGNAIWIFWGTGDKENPSFSGTEDKFFGIKDPDRTTTYSLANLEDITSSIFTGSQVGWTISFPAGEKVLTDSAVFGGMVSWTTYIPYTGPDLCIRAGSAKLYAIAMMPMPVASVKYEIGAGLFAASTGNQVGTRSMVVGAGLAQVPVFSQKPGGSGATDLIVTTSGGAGQAASIVTSSDLPNSPLTQRLQMTAPMAQILNWWDRRVQ